MQRPHPISRYGISGSVLLLNPTDRDLPGRYGTTGKIIRDDATLRGVAAGVANTPPVVSAGVDQSIQLPATASLVGTATDDGLPASPGAITRLWSKVSGPGTVTFGNSALASTSATFSVAGTYVLMLAVTDGQWAVSDVMTVVVAAA